MKKLHSYSQGTLLKLVIPLFLIILISDEIIPISIYHFIKISINKQIERQIQENEKGSAKDTLILDLNSQLAQKILKGKKEFSYNNSMFDLIEKKIIDSSLYLICINDVKEKQLKETYKNIINANSDYNSQISHKLHLFAFDGIFRPVSNRITLDFKIINFPNIFFHINENFISPNSPPPRLI